LIAWTEHPSYAADLVNRNLNQRDRHQKRRFWTPPENADQDDELGGNLYHAGERIHDAGKDVPDRVGELTAGQVVEVVLNVSVAKGGNI
jgi:hypothetical protein